MPAERKITTDHEEIRRWTEGRGGKPSTVRGSAEEGQAGVLRLDFPGYRGSGKLQEISWDEFFKKFDEKGLAFLYQETTSEGKQSRFFKLIRREGATLERPRRRHPAGGSRRDDSRGTARHGNLGSNGRASAGRETAPLAFAQPLERPDPPASESSD